LISKANQLPVKPTATCPWTSARSPATAAPQPGATGHDHHHREAHRPAHRARGYAIPAGERILYGQRVDGVVRITDNPADSQGRAYLVERGLEQDGNSALKALVADYLAQAQRLREIPMASSPIERYVQHLT
jgi:hypothetical protein